jgi:hypothetical protein
MSFVWCILYVLILVMSSYAHEKNFFMEIGKLLSFDHGYVTFYTFSLSW